MTSPVLSVYLGNALRSQWDAHCKSQNVRSSTALKEVVVYLLSKNNRPQNFQEIISTPDTTKVRLELRLSASEYEATKVLADVTGANVNRYVANLLRSHLTQAPQFHQRELDAVTQSNAQLMKIGSNLNQIARAINRNPLETDFARVDLMRDVSSHIKDHTRSIAMLIQANLQRWKVK
ncbi:plasmid mobilization relaxosome protein MobC [Methylovorus sp. SPW-M1]